MKRIFIISITLFIFVFSCTQSTPTKTETFKVWGNCEKCKKTIEAACVVNGVKEKDWNVDSKLMTITYDTTAVSINDIKQLIAKSGYDNDTYYGDDYAYDKLESCCQYERKPIELP